MLNILTISSHKFTLAARHEGRPVHQPPGLGPALQAGGGQEGSRDEEEDVGGQSSAADPSRGSCLPVTIIQDPSRGRLPNTMCTPRPVLQKITSEANQHQSCQLNAIIALK